MKKMRLMRGCNALYLIIIGIASLGLAGCATKQTLPDNGVGAENLPRINSIGSSAILNFEKGKDVVIPIEGRNLRDWGCDISVSIEAPIPLVSGKDYYLDKTSEGTSPSLIFLKVVGSVTTNLNSKDHLLVNVCITEEDTNAILKQNTLRTAKAASVNQWSSTLISMASTLTPAQMSAFQQGNVDSDVARRLGLNAALGGFDSVYKTSMENWLQSKDPSPASPTLKKAFDDGYEQARIEASLKPSGQIEHSIAGDTLSSDSRTFILFTPDDYRSEVLANQIEIQNITAFPLPESEASKLFGDFVAQKFYAVRLTLLNPTKEDQIVSLGLIKAYGRALVEPVPVGPKTRFTRPIEVAPQSQQQVYTMVQSPRGDFLDDETGAGDAQAIRDWTFGALEFAGALASAYGTGFGASEDYVKAVALTTGTAIPGLDKWFGDKRSFHLLNIVNFAMPDLVKVPRGGSLDGKYLFFSKGKLQAVLQDPRLDLVSDEPAGFKDASFYAKVIYLEFDTLQIPFENTTSASGSNNIANQVEILKSTAAGLIEEYKQIENGWTESADGTASGTFATLAGADYNNLNSSLKVAIPVATAITPAQYPNIAALTNSLLILQTNAILLKPSSLAKNIFDSPNYNSLKLTGCLDQLQGVETGLLQGQPESLYQNTVDSVANTINSAQYLLSYYKTIAEDIKQNSPWTSIAKISAADKSSLDNATNNLNSIIQNLPKQSVLK